MDGGKKLFHRDDFRRSEKANTSIKINAIMLIPGRQRDSHNNILQSRSKLVRIAKEQTEEKERRESHGGSQVYTVTYGLAGTRNLILHTIVSTSSNCKKIIVSNQQNRQV